MMLLLNSKINLVKIFEIKIMALGGMSTKELIARLDAVPFEEFQNGLKEKIKIVLVREPDD